MYLGEREYFLLTVVVGLVILYIAWRFDKYE